jgi:hypothetical protein
MGDLSISAATQLAIFMQNQPGMLARACEALAQAQVQIMAMATEAGSFGARGDEILVRMIVNEPARAAEALSAVGATAVQTEVLMIEGAGRAGMLGLIARRLAEARVNIESVIVSAMSQADRCLVILRPSNAERAMRVLHDL